MNDVPRVWGHSPALDLGRYFVERCKLAVRLSAATHDLENQNAKAPHIACFRVLVLIEHLDRRPPNGQLSPLKPDVVGGV
jgi:hypothetical protein